MQDFNFIFCSSMALNGDKITSYEKHYKHSTLYTWKKKDFEEDEVKENLCTLHNRNAVTRCKNKLALSCHRANILTFIYWNKIHYCISLLDMKKLKFAYSLQVL